MEPFLRSYRLEQASGFGRRVHQSRNLSSPEFVERQRLRKSGELHTKAQRTKDRACGQECSAVKWPKIHWLDAKSSSEWISRRARIWTSSSYSLEMYCRKFSMPGNGACRFSDASTSV